MFIALPNDLQISKSDSILRFIDIQKQTQHTEALSEKVLSVQSKLYLEQIFVTHAFIHGYYFISTTSLTSSEVG